MGSVVGGLIAGAGAIGGALIGKKGAEKAAKEATDAQLEMYYMSRADLEPYMGAGEWAIGQAEGDFNAQEYLEMNPDVAAHPWASQNPELHYRLYGQKEGRAPNKGARGLKGMIEAGPGEFVPEEQPGYQFGYEQFVERPTTRAASALGQLRSGKTGKALTRYASDYASTEYDKWLGRYYQKMDPYFRMAGIGQASAAGAAQITPNTAPYAYAGRIGETNALLAGLGGVAGAGQNFVTWYQTQQALGNQNALGYYDQPDLMQGPYKGKYGR